MTRTRLASLVGLFASLSACSSGASSDSASSSGDFYPNTPGATGGAGGAGQSYDAGASMDSAAGSYTGGSAGAGEAADAGSADRPPEGADAGPEAGPDAGPTCDDLDKTQPEVLYLSADDSNSMASPAIARRLIRTGGYIPASIIRTYEFLNYYNVPFEPADPGTLRIVAQMGAGAADTDRELMIGVQSQAPSTPRRPMTITFVLDTSGSMGGTPIDYERAVVKAVASSMRAGDIVSAVTWSDTNAVVLSGHEVSGPNDSHVVQLADSLQANGSTNLQAGLQTGYQLAQAHFGSGRINRVILVSDGQANVGVTDENLIGAKADDENKEGIYMVGVGVGDGVNDTLMNVVTDAGNGAYVYIDSESEAQVMFGSRFDETIDVAARAVQVKLTMPWYFQMYKFHGEQYSGDPKKVKPQHLAPGDAMVFDQVLRACAAEQIVDTDPVELTATWKDPFDYSDKSVTVSSTLGDLLGGSDKELKRTRAIVAYAETLKATADYGSQSAATVDAAIQVVNAADDGSGDWAITEIKSLLAAYRSRF